MSAKRKGVVQMDETVKGETALIAREVTPATLLQLAVQKDADLERLEKLMELQVRWEANEARKAFVVALGNFKANPPELLKNKHVEFGNTKYDHATLDHVSDAIGRALAVHGISHRWDIEQNESIIKVACIVTHNLGHSERVTMQASADTSGSKNSIQAIGSTVTYLQRYTLLAACGVAVKGQDSDGRIEQEFGLGENIVADNLAAIDSCADIQSLQAAFTAAYVLAKDGKDKVSMRSFTKAKDVRKKILQAGAA